MKKINKLIMLTIFLCMAITFFTACQKNEASYAIIIAQSQNGTVTADKTQAKKGETVQLTVSSTVGYRLEMLIVNGENVAADVVSNQYSLSVGSADIEISATFTAITSTVTLNYGEGSGTPATLSVTFGQPYGTLPTATPPQGYDFDGWYSAETGGSKILATTLVAVYADSTLYARYLVRPLSVIFNYDTLAGGAGSILTMPVVFGEAIGTLPTPTSLPEGSTFFGWMDEDGKDITSIYLVDFEEDLVLYAKYLTVEISGNPSKLTIMPSGWQEGYTDSATIIITTSVNGAAYDFSEVSLLAKTEDMLSINGLTITPFENAYGSTAVDIIGDGNVIASFVIEAADYSAYSVIETVADFKAVTANGKYVFVNDLDWNGDFVMKPDWTMLHDTFNGTLDGNGHSFKNATLLDGWNKGIFGTLAASGIIRNIAFINISMASNANYPYGTALVGYCQGIMENIFLSYSYVITGGKDGPDWFYCGATLAGSLEGGGTIRNCVVYVDSKVADCTGNASLVSFLSSYTSILENCFAVTKLENVPMINKKGAEDILAENIETYNSTKRLLESQNLETFNSFWSVFEGALLFGGNTVLSATLEWEVDFGSDITLNINEAVILSGIVYNFGDITSTYPELTFESSNESVLEVDDNLIKGIGAGEATITIYIGSTAVGAVNVNVLGIYLLSTKEDFMTIGNDLLGIYILANDIDLEGAEMNNPFGTSWTTPFAGVLDGNGFALKNFVIGHASDGIWAGWDGGIFMIFDGTIKNIAFLNVSFAGNAPNENGIVSIAQNGALIENVYMTICIDVDGAAENFSGCLVGSMYDAKISNCIVVIVNWMPAWDDETKNKIAAVAGTINAWASAIHNTFVICDGTMLEIGLGGAAVIGYDEVNVQKYASIGALFASDPSTETFDEELWTFDSDNNEIWFGENKLEWFIKE